MNQNHIRLVIFMAGLVVLCSCTHVKTDKGEAWPGVQKIRAGYCQSWIPAEATLEKLENAGFNAIMVKTHLGRWEKHPELLEKWLESAQAHNISVLAIINYNSITKKDDLLLPEIPHFTAESNREFDIACPYSPKTWDVIAKEIDYVASFTQKYKSLKGLIIDMEMYGVNQIDRGSFEDSPYCHCGFCQSNCVNSTAKNDCYEHFLISNLIKMKDEIRKKSPHFVFGFMPPNFKPEFILDRCLIKGLGDVSVPVLIVDEASYGGYISKFGAMKDIAAKIGHTVYLPGIFLYFFSAEDIQGEIYKLAINSGGWWLYPVDHLTPEFMETIKTGTIKCDEVPKSKAEEYWPAFKNVNAEIVKHSVDPAYKSQLEKTKPVSVFFPIMGGFNKIPRLIPLKPSDAEIKQSSPVRLRDQQSWVILLAENETLNFHVLNQQLGENRAGTIIVVSDAQGEKVFETTLPYGESKEYNLSAIRGPGLFRITCRSQANVTCVSIRNKYAGLDASVCQPWSKKLKGLWCCRQNNTLYFYLPANAGKVALWLDCGGGQSAKVVLYNPLEKPVEEIVIKGEEKEIPIIVGKENAGVWQLRIMPAEDEKSFQDLRYALLSESDIPVFLSTAPERLLIPCPEK